MWNLEKNFDKVVAISEENKIYYYSDLINIVNKVSKIIESRSLVFILCSNTFGSLSAYVSSIENKIVPLLINNQLDKKLFEILISTYEPNYLWLDKKNINKIPFSECSVTKILEVENYILFKTNYEKVELYNELGLLLTTSGSTGSPKLVRQSYTNIKDNAEAIVKYLELDSDERPITSLPMSYTYGLSIINSHLLVGSTIIMTTKSYMQKEFWDFFRKEEATSLAGVPYHYEMLKRLKFFNMNLPSLQYMTQAGGKLSPELHKEFAEYSMNNNKRFYVMYGATEATARMSYLPYEQGLSKYGSIGVAIPGGRFYLLDSYGDKILEAGEIGELVYEGRNVTLGYALEKIDLEKGDERNGRLITGDMARFDRDGYYYIVGRKKRFVKLFGNRVSLDEVENLIKNGFENIDCACTGVDDKMYIYITSTNEELIHQVRKFISGKINIHFSAFSVIGISEIPKNDSGKTLYKNLTI